MKLMETERDTTVIDAHIKGLVGDGPKTLNMLYKIKTGQIPQHISPTAELKKARYEDWKDQQAKKAR